MISSNPRNIPFYGRHGFTALSTKISAGVVITGMIRLKAQKKINVLLTTNEEEEEKGAAGGEKAVVAAETVAEIVPKSKDVWI